MHKVIVLLGSNIEPEKHMNKAQKLLEKVFSDIKFSKTITTSPLGFSDQPDFLNALAFFSAGQDKEEIEKKLKEIEEALGRKRDPENKNGPRTIDIDIIEFDGQAVSDDFLTKPFVTDLLSGRD